MNFLSFLFSSLGFSKTLKVLTQKLGTQSNLPEKSFTKLAFHVFAAQQLITAVNRFCTFVLVIVYNTLHLYSTTVQCDKFCLSVSAAQVNQPAGEPASNGMMAA